MGFRNYITESNKNITVYFDLDSTLANFIDKVLEHVPEWTKDDLEGQTMSDTEFWPKVLDIPNFWESLELIPSGMLLLKYAVDKGYNVEILSSPSRNDKRSVKGKHIWVQKHLSKYGITKDKVNLVRARNKADFAKSNTLLVDDLEKNIVRFKASGGFVLKFDEKTTTLTDFKKVLSKVEGGQVNESIDSLKELEDSLNSISKGIKDVKLSKHFIERISDRSIDMDLIVDTIEKFLKRYKPSLEQSHQKEISGLIKHMLEHLNIAISYDTNGTQGKMDDDVLKLVTVMKKKNFVSNSSKDTIYKVR